MSIISDSKEINRLINFLNGKGSLNCSDIKEIIDFIKKDPQNKETNRLRDHVYQLLLNYNKSMLKLEEVLLNDKLKTQERRLNIYKTIMHGNYNPDLCRWSYLLELTDEINSFYDYIKNIGMYVDLNDKNEFFYRLNNFILSEDFNFDTYNLLLKRKLNPYPTNRKIISNYRANRGKCENYTKELGLYGELCSHLFLMQELNKNNQKDLAKRSIWVAKEIGDFFGFDQTSFNDKGEELIMEVKTTNSSRFEEEKDNFYMTSNEFSKMKSMSKEYDYSVVRVYINQKGIAELYYLKPNDDGSIEYNDIKYVPAKKNKKDQIEFKREPKKKVFSIGGLI